jgi:hypothetical protein
MFIVARRVSPDLDRSACAERESALVSIEKGIECGHAWMIHETVIIRPQSFLEEPPWAANACRVDTSSERCRRQPSG